MKCLWLLLSGYLLVDLCIAEEEVELRYACWGSAGPPVVSAQCPVGTVIQILRSGLKVKRVRSYQCQYSDEDCGCTVDDKACNMPDTMALCMGRSQCRLDVMQQYINTDSCRGFSDYMYVEFKCVRVNGQVQDICQSTMAERSVGFIQSPDYPSKYSSNTLCSCNLTSESTVSLSMLDVAMTDDADGGCKNDRVTIVANGQRYNHCGMERPSKAQAIAKSINIEFETNNEDVSNGFWLKYQAVEQNTTISISCRSTFKPPPSTTSTTTTTTPAHTTTTIAPTTTTIATTTEQSKDKPTPSLIKSTHRVESSFNKDFNVDKVKEQSNVKDNIDEDYEYKTNMPSFKMKTPSYPTQRWSSFSHLLPNEKAKSSVLPPNIYAKTVMEKIRNTHTNPYTKPSPKFNHELIPKELPGQKYQHIYGNLNPDRHIFSPPRRKPQQPPSNQPSIANYNNPPLPSTLAPPIAPNPHFNRDANPNEECIYVALPGGMVTVQCKPKSRTPPRQKSRKGMSNLKSKQNNRKAMHENTKVQSREEDISRTKWHTKSFEEEDKDTEIDDENEDQENVINNETDSIQSEIDENKDEINELELKEELTNEIAEIEDRESNKKSKNYSGQFEQDPITGQNPGENKQESLTGSNPRAHEDSTKHPRQKANLKTYFNNRMGHPSTWKTESTTAAVPPFYPRNWIDISSKHSLKHGVGGMGFGPNGKWLKVQHLTTVPLHRTWLRKPTNKPRPTKPMHVHPSVSPKSKSKLKKLNDLNVKHNNDNQLKSNIKSNPKVHKVRPNHPDLSFTGPSSARNTSVVIGDGTTVKPHAKSTLELMFGDRVTIIAASVIGSILMIVVLGIIIRFVVNRADPNQQVRRNHKKECVIHKHPQNNMA